MARTSQVAAHSLDINLVGKMVPISIHSAQSTVPHYAIPFQHPHFSSTILPHLSFKQH